MPLDSYPTVPNASGTYPGLATGTDYRALSTPYRAPATPSSSGGAWSGAASGAAAGAAAGPYGIAIGAGIGALSGYFSSKRQAEATTQAQQLQNTANRRATMFTRQQAEQTWRDQERVNQANYEQNAARERRYNEVAQRLGLGVAQREIPAYVPGQDPHLDVEPVDPEPYNPKKGVESTYKTLDQMLGGTSSPSSTSGAQMPQGIDPRFAALYQRYGVTPGARGSGPADWQYYQTDAVHNANGDVNYVLGRLEADLKGHGTSTASRPTSSTDLLARTQSPGLPYQPLPMVNPYQVGGSYF